MLKKQGLAQGEKQKTLEIAKTMLKNNVETDLIIKYTGITKEDLNKLKK